jgi:sarcosine oxidase subunit beta
MAALAAAAREAGAEIVTDARVDEIGVASGAVSYVRGGDVRVEAPVVLNAAGPWAPYVAQLVEAYLPIFPSRAHVTHTAPLGEYVARPYILTAAWDLGACQWADGRMQLGGGANTGDPQRFSFRKQTVPEFVARIRRRAGEVFPALAGVELERAWAGTMECTPDMMPIVGPVDGPDGFFVCAGFSGHGFCLGPLMGELMAEWLADGQPSIDLSAFRHDRFVRPEGPLAVVAPGVQKAG